MTFLSLYAIVKWGSSPEDNFYGSHGISNPEYVVSFPPLALLLMTNLYGAPYHGLTDKETDESWDIFVI